MIEKPKWTYPWSRIIEDRTTFSFMITRETTKATVGRKHILKTMGIAWWIEDMFIKVFSCNWTEWPIIRPLYVFMTWEIRAFDTCVLHGINFLKLMISSNGFRGWSTDKGLGRVTRSSSRWRTRWLWCAIWWCRTISRCVSVQRRGGWWGGSRCGSCWGFGTINVTILFIVYGTVVYTFFDVV